MARKGQIPYEITGLQGLVVLNLSRNALLGEIPKDIGQMKELLTLDLSKNKFSGGLPSSMSQMNLLDYLDVSHNNLSGRIPSSTQLQSFEPSRYIGNAGLCGPPLTKYCPGDKELEVTPVVGESKSDDEGIDELKRWFYIGGAAGFPTGFWMAVGTLLLNRHRTPISYNTRGAITESRPHDHQAGSRFTPQLHKSLETLSFFFFGLSLIIGVLNFCFFFGVNFLGASSIEFLVGSDGSASFGAPTIVEMFNFRFFGVNFLGASSIDFSFTSSIDFLVLLPLL
ncbi:leucine-rich repeat domain, L domain-like protein [Artemisia annua]|uniref:Leucine-rich repeat domain, L domain-like protein n=1 Tax=Artemisia annua TaxID=35608 RepID=A0A2U1PZN8_ARTAN|nr:leucine-rich repeat domain, L domain-like protein [Artemisia annua]